MLWKADTLHWQRTDRVPTNVCAEATRKAAQFDMRL